MTGPTCVCVLILLTVLTGCSCQFTWVPMSINTYTSRRIMSGAADYIGLRLIRELYAYQKMNRRLYKVTFEGRRPFGWTHTCTAKVQEFIIFRPEVLSYRCWPPVY